jgi:mannonate dehydratase
MKSTNHHLDKSRRNALKMIGLGSAAFLTGGFRSAAAINPQVQDNLQKSQGGLPPIKIRSVKAIGTKPGGSNLVVVKVETTEPGLYGLGCATFTQELKLL